MAAILYVKADMHIRRSKQAEYGQKFLCDRLVSGNVEAFMKSDNFIKTSESVVAAIRRYKELRKPKLSHIIITICMLVLFFLLVQFIPWVVKYFHINDLKIGKILVYSLPIPFGITVYLVWRS